MVASTAAAVPLHVTAFVICMTLCVASTQPLEYYYITPSPATTPCPGEPCFTLLEYTTYRSQNPSSASIVLVFLAGTHTLVNQGVGARNISTFTMLGDSTALPALQTVITCSTRSGPVLGFDFDNVRNVIISSLVFTGCGHEKLLSVLFYINRVSLLSVKSCLFKDNRLTSALALRFSTGHISNSSFTKNTAKYHGSVLWTEYSHVEFLGSNCFTDNLALRRCSVINSEESVVVFNSSQGIPAYYLNEDKRCFYGATSIVDNSVSVANADINNCCGGAMCLLGSQLEESDSELRVYGKSRWVHNFMYPPADKYLASPYWGGALYAENSSITFSGDHCFTNNIAGIGGAINVMYTTFNTTGSFRMENNTAYYGGALFAYKTLFHGQGITVYSSNWCVQSVYTRGGSVVFFACEVYFNGSVTVHNSSAYVSAIEVSYSNSVFVGNSTFIANRGILCAALYVASSSVSFFGDTRFESNFGTRQLAIFHLYLSNIELNGNFVLVNNSIYGGLQAVRSNGTISGNAIISNNSGSTGGGFRLIVSNFFLQCSIDFENNRARFIGGALNAFNSTIVLSGRMNLKNNSAPRGGGMFLQALSTLLFNPPLQVYAQHNMADRGAAIFVEDVITYNICLPTTDPLFPYQDEPVWCFFYTNTSRNDISSGTVYLMFEDNVASVAGTTLYGGMLDTCPLLKTKSPGVTGLQEFESISHTLQDGRDTTSFVASDALQLCFCFQNTTNCSKLSTDVFYVRRGEPFTVQVIALGQANGSVPSLIRAQFPSSSNRDSFLGNTEDIQESGNLCSELQYSVFSPQENVEFTVYADGPCRDIGDSSRSIRVSLLPCPIGFQLSFATCICHPVIQPFTNSCNVVDGTIRRSATAKFWIGVVYENKSFSGLITHTNCPFDYCKNEKIFINLNTSDFQCAFNRTGILCGECRSGLSLTLGSSHCLPCISAYVTLVLPLALAGVMLVAFLLFLKLTVAVGTINGLVFYANVIAVNSSTFFPNTDTFNLSRLFISWLNLDLGITTCFYNGMDSLAKVGVQFLFPSYVWLLMGGVIITSHYSSRASRLFGRNPVAVLSTLTLLSYTKILRTIITIFSFTLIKYPDGHSKAVWLYDGNVQFLQGRHIPLFLVALLVLLVLFIPYTLYLMFGQCILTGSKTRLISWMSNSRLWPFLDAYHSPFSTRHRYWPGLLLLLRCALFLVTAFNVSGNPSINLLAITTSLLGVFAVRWINGLVYRHRALDVLEIFFILNLSLLSVGTYHILVAGGNQAALVHLSVGTAFGTFIGITFYHTYMVMKETQMVKSLLQTRVHFLRVITNLRSGGHQIPTLEDTPTNRNVTTTVIPSPHDLQVQLRESRLDSY